MDPTGFTPEDSVLAALDGGQEDATGAGEMNAVEALKHIDDHWYKKVVGKRTRWMDLIGDYAGNERFILDGTVTVRSGSVSCWRLHASRGVVVAARYR
jgi:hypothetical protein